MSSFQIQESLMDRPPSPFRFSVDSDLCCQGCAEPLGDPDSYDAHRCSALVLLEEAKELRQLREDNARLKRENDYLRAKDKN